MLHITSLVQRLAKLNNNPSKITTHRDAYLNALNRNYSFVYDTYSNRVDFNYEEASDESGWSGESEHESRGYWGYMRDKKADRQSTAIERRRRHRQRRPSSLSYNPPSASSSNTSADSSSSAESTSTSATCHWGLFTDESIIVPNSSPSSATNSPVLVDPSNGARCSRAGSTSLVGSRRGSSADHADEADSASAACLASRKLIYDYKWSQFKIEAGKRDQMKMFIQQLQEEEEKMKKDSYKLLRENKVDSEDLRTVRLLYISSSNITSHDETENTTHIKNFQRSFNTLNKLNKPISMLNMAGCDLHSCLPFSSISLSAGDFATGTRRSSTVSLCSNLDLKMLRNNSHLTTVFEHGGVKLGFMALFDEAFCVNKKLNSRFAGMTYKDFVLEANRLSEQLRACGASLVVALTNFDDAESETRLLNECSGVNLILSSSSSNSASASAVDVPLKTSPSRAHLLKFEPNSLDYLHLITLRIDLSSSVKIAHIDLDKYYV